MFVVFVWSPAWGRTEEFATRNEALDYASQFEMWEIHNVEASPSEATLVAIRDVDGWEHYYPAGTPAYI